MAILSDVKILKVKELIPNAKNVIIISQKYNFLVKVFQMIY